MDTAAVDGFTTLRELSDSLLERRDPTLHEVSFDSSVFLDTINLKFFDLYTEKRQTYNVVDPLPMMNHHHNNIVLDYFLPWDKLARMTNQDMIQPNKQDLQKFFNKDMLHVFLTEGLGYFTRKERNDTKPRPQMDKLLKGIMQIAFQSICHWIVGADKLKLLPLVGDNPDVVLTDQWKTQFDSALSLSKYVSFCFLAYDAKFHWSEQIMDAYIQNHLREFPDPPDERLKFPPGNRKYVDHPIAGGYEELFLDYFFPNMREAAARINQATRYCHVYGFYHTPGVAHSKLLLWWCHNTVTSEAKALMEAFFVALHAVHLRDIFHHDLTDQNIFVKRTIAKDGTPSYEVRFIDFETAHGFVQIVGALRVKDERKRLGNQIEGRGYIESGNGIRIGGDELPSLRRLLHESNPKIRVHPDDHDTRLKQIHDETELRENIEDLMRVECLNARFMIPTLFYPHFFHPYHDDTQDNRDQVQQNIVLNIQNRYYRYRHAQSGDDVDYDEFYKYHDLMKCITEVYHDVLATMYADAVLKHATLFGYTYTPNDTLRQQGEAFMNGPDPDPVSPKEETKEGR